MAFNKGKPFHGSENVAGGKLVGTTDTDYFYFFCPKCPPRQVMRVLEHGLRHEGPGGKSYPDERPKQAADFVLAFKLYCPSCKLTDFVKVSNIGWQGGTLPVSGS
jgi:hypothetical protein